ncbi:MAG: phosphomannose isomerase type II C-terminal cupin domain [Candidatus Diapherotrites archaeon]|nr:phosphomannose isomerase type II C-terminal cupin domain [Candidatus Diapherotrites archaeon]
MIYEEKRPWGLFKTYAFNEKCTVKILEVNPKQQLSLQSHKKRSELWVALDDGCYVQIGNKIKKLVKGDFIIIKKRQKHRLISKGKKFRVLEISFGKFDEHDEIRYEDIYGRTNKNK